MELVAGKFSCYFLRRTVQRGVRYYDLSLGVLLEYMNGGCVC